MPPKLRILAIDDEVRALDLFKVNLESRGYEVLTAANGIDGPIIAKEAQPDLIFLDVRMPEVDGWSVCKRLKQDDSTRRIPIVFLTAYSSDRDRRRAEELGVREYLVKPVDPNVIIKLIEEITGESSGTT